MTAKKPSNHRVFYLLCRIASMVMLLFILSNLVHPTAVTAQELIPILEEKFENNDFDGWTIDSNATGDFRAENGHLIGNGYVQAIYDKFDWGVGAFALEFDLLKLEIGSVININLQHSNMGSYSVGIERIDENNLYIELTRVIWNKSEQTLANNQGQLFRYLPGRIYHVRVYFGDGNLNLYITKQGQNFEGAVFLPVLSAQDENPLPPGGIFLEFHKEAFVILDNLLVSGPQEIALPSEEMFLDIPEFSHCIDQELLYAEDFEDSTAQGWDLEEGWGFEGDMLMGEGHSFANYAQERWEDLTLYVTFMFPSHLEGLHINIRVSDTGRYFLWVNPSGIGLVKQLGWGEGEQFIEMDHLLIPIESDMSHTVGFSAHHGLLEVSLDGVQQLSIRDDNFLPAGGISFETLDDSVAFIESLWVCGTVPETHGEEQPSEEMFLDIPEFSHCIDQELLYSEDFEDSTAQGWDLEEGWGFEGDMLMGEGHSFANYAQERWEDLTLYVTFMFPSQLEGLHINIRVSDAGRYFLWVNPSGIGLVKQLGWGLGDQFIEMDHVPIPIEFDMFHTVGFSAHRGLLEVSLDGVQQISMQDKDFLPAGGISFETLDDSVAFIKSLWVCGTVPETQGEEQPSAPPDTTEPIELPDLQIGGLDFADFDLGGSILPLTITVKNLGGSPAEDTWLHVQQHAGVAVQASQSIGTLPPGEARHIRVNLEIPVELLGRTVRFDVSLDPENNVREHNENNNNLVSDRIQLPSVSSGFDWRNVIIAAGVLLGITAVILLARAIHRRGETKKEEKRKVKPVPTIAPPLRLLRLWVTEGHPDKGVRIRANQPLISGHTYTLHAQVLSEVKKPKRQANVAANKTALSYDLVVFSPESDYHISEGNKKLRIMSSGSSKEITWSFYANQTGTRRVRVCLFYGNSLLQSAYVDAQIINKKTRRTRKHKQGTDFLSGKIDYVSNATLTGFKNEPQPSITILTNQDANGKDWIAVYAGGDDIMGTSGSQPRLVNPDYIRSRANVIRGWLWRIIQESQYRIGEISPTTRTELLEKLEKDLARLAGEGWATFDDLFMHEVTREVKRNYEEKLRPPGLISVNRCRGDKTTLPWAAIYDLYVDSADLSRLKLCPIFKAELAEHWSEALTDFRAHADWLDNPQGCRENPHCPLKNTDTRQFTICPFGFWGFRHQISQPHQLVKPASHGQIPQAIVRSVRDGNSTRFDQTIFLKRDRNQILKVALGVHPGIDHAGQWTAAFQSLLPGGVEPLVSTDRDEIKRMLEQGGFHICLLYCHGEIDNVSKRFKLDFGQRTLSWENLDPDAQWPLDPKPLVILNACNTVSTTPEVLYRMLDGLHELGASGVIGTEIKVSSSLAYEFILAAMKRFVVDGASIGEAFLAERKTLLRHFSPLGLVYSYYAPAALHLHQEGRCSWCTAHGIQDADDEE